MNLFSHQSPTKRRHTRSSFRRRGIVLVIVLVVVTIIALAGFSFVAFMLTEKKGVALRGEELQAQAILSSGEEFLNAFLEQPSEVRDDAGGTSDNPEVFRAVSVLEDEISGNNGRFSVIYEQREDESEPLLRFGVENESARLNLAAVLQWDRIQPGAGRRALLALPGMTSAIADSLLDWIDSDSQDRENGAEADYYAGLDPPYAPRNGLPESLEELLLVKGVTREQLFGASTPGLSGDMSDSLSGFDASSEFGGSRFSDGLTSASAGKIPWSSLLTLSSAERNENSRGEPRINMNEADLAKLRQSLAERFDERLARFVLLYRQFGPNPGKQTGVDASTVEVNPGNPARFQIVSLLDLVDARVSVPNSTGLQPTIVVSPLLGDREAMRQELPKLLDEATVEAVPVLYGRVNINEASPLVLSAVPGFDRSLVEQVVSARKNQVAGDRIGRRHPTWLLIDGLVDLAKMRLLLPYLTGGGDVHRAEIIGFFDQVGPTTRTEFLIDATTRPARSVYWKDLRSLGMKYTVEDIGVEQPTAGGVRDTPGTPNRRRSILTQAGAVSDSTRSR